MPVLYLERRDNPHNECVYQGRLNTAPVLSGQVPSRSLAHPVSRLFAAVGSGGPFRWELGLGRYLNWRCSPRPHRRAAIARPDQATTPSPSTIRPPPANQPGTAPTPAGRHATVTMRPPENDEYSVRDKDGPPQPKRERGEIRL